MYYTILAVKHIITYYHILYYTMIVRINNYVTEAPCIPYMLQ